jgi:hypothetical protein
MMAVKLREVPGIPVVPWMPGYILNLQEYYFQSSISMPRLTVKSVTNQVV